MARISTMTTTERRATPKQMAYVDARLRGANPTQAYRAAYACNNMSTASVYREAMRMEAHPIVAPLIDQAQRKAVRKVEITAEKVLERAWEIASSDDRDRVPALALASKAFTLFKDAAPVDQSQHIHLEGVSVEDLKAMLGQAKALPEETK